MKITTELMLKFLIKTSLATFIIVSGRIETVSAAVLGTGTTIHTFLECLNDGVALQVGNNPVDAQGWQYTIDSNSDGVAGTDVGGNEYEIYGMAVRETETSLWFVLNGNTPLTGNSAVTAADGNIGWGDLFLNFSGMDFQTAMESGNLFAIRFAGTNDSGVDQIGVYQQAKAKSVTNSNSGFLSLQQYNSHVVNYGGFPSLGDLPANSPYFNLAQSWNVIESGNYLTGIEYLSEQDLLKGGYNPSLFAGLQTIAFKWDKAPLPSQSVPEPSILFGLFGVLGAILSKPFKKY